MARTDDDVGVDDAIARLVAAVDDLTDYGTAQSTAAGGVTVPAAARDALGLNPGGLWRVFGSPALGFALIVGPRKDARASLEFLLGDRGPDDRK